MSASSSLIRHSLKIPSNMALRCLKPSSPRPLASTRLAGRIGNNISRPFAGVTSIPTIGYEHPPDIPSERVLSRLSISSQRRDEPHTHTERNQGTVWKSPEAQRREQEKAQKTAQRPEQEGSQQTDKSATVSGPFLVNGVGNGGCVTGDQSEHKGHGSEQIRGQALRRQCLITVAGTTADMMAVVVGSLTADGDKVMVNALGRPRLVSLYSIRLM